MFDTVKVGKRIRSARVEKNMTQMDLADKMGVSFQAVSNWERGASMPDIGKLGDLSEVLSLNMDELLEGEGKTIKKVLDGEEMDAEELKDVAAMVPPKKMKEIVDKKKEEYSVSSLVGLAPFLSSEDLADLIKDRVVDDLGSLVAVAPFLDEDDLLALTRRAKVKSPSSLVALAPFLESSDLMSLIGEIDEDADPSSFIALAPFLDSDDLSKLVRGRIKSGKMKAREGRSIFSFMDEEEIVPLLKKAIEKRDYEALEKMAKFTDEDDLGDCLVDALTRGDLRVREIIPVLKYLCDDHISEMMKVALKNKDYEGAEKLSEYI